MEKRRSSKANQGAMSETDLAKASAQELTSKTTTRSVVQFTEDVGKSYSECRSYTESDCDHHTEESGASSTQFSRHKRVQKVRERRPENASSSLRTNCEKKKASCISGSSSRHGNDGKSKSGGRSIKTTKVEVDRNAKQLKNIREENNQDLTEYVEMTSACSEDDCNRPANSISCSENQYESNNTGVFTRLSSAENNVIESSATEYSDDSLHNNLARLKNYVKVEISQLPRDITKKELVEMFSYYGPCYHPSLEISGGVFKGNGVIFFERKEDALAAITQLNGQRQFHGTNWPLEVRLADSNYYYYHHQSNDDDRSFTVAPIGDASSHYAQTTAGKKRNSNMKKDSSTTNYTVYSKKSQQNSATTSTGRSRAVYNPLSSPRKFADGGFNKNVDTDEFAANESMRLQQKLYASQSLHRGLHKLMPYHSPTASGFRFNQHQQFFPQYVSQYPHTVRSSFVEQQRPFSPPAGVKYSTYLDTSPNWPWVTYYTQDGIPFYYNTQTGLSQWNAPDHLPVHPPPTVPLPTPTHLLVPSGEQPQRHDGRTPGSPPRKTTSTGPPGANLFIFHIPPFWTKHDLIVHFSKFGHILSAKIVVDRATGKNKGYSFVSYKNIASAIQAVREMNNMVIGNKRLYVEIKNKELQYAKKYAREHNLCMHPRCSATSPRHSLPTIQLHNQTLQHDVRLHPAPTSQTTMRPHRHRLVATPSIPSQSELSYHDANLHAASDPRPHSPYRSDVNSSADSYQSLSTKLIPTTSYATTPDKYLPSAYTNVVYPVPGQIILGQRVLPHHPIPVSAYESTIHTPLQHQ